MNTEFMLLKEWLEIYPEMKEKEIKCKECRGEGSHECSECGQETTCDNCGGHGVTNTAAELYEKQKRKDINLLKELNLYDYKKTTKAGGLNATAKIKT